MRKTTGRWIVLLKVFAVLAALFLPGVSASASKAGDVQDAGSTRYNLRFYGVPNLPLPSWQDAWSSYRVDAQQAAEMCDQHDDCWGFGMGNGMYVQFLASTGTTCDFTSTLLAHWGGTSGGSCNGCTPGTNMKGSRSCPSCGARCHGWMFYAREGKPCWDATAGIHDAVSHPSGACQQAQEVTVSPTPSPTTAAPTTSAPTKSPTTFQLSGTCENPASCSSNSSCPELMCSVHDGTSPTGTGGTLLTSDGLTGFQANAQLITDESEEWTLVMWMKSTKRDGHNFVTWGQGVNMPDHARQGNIIQTGFWNKELWVNFAGCWKLASRILPEKDIWYKFAFGMVKRSNVLYAEMYLSGILLQSTPVIPSNCYPSYVGIQQILQGQTHGSASTATLFMNDVRYYPVGITQAAVSLPVASFVNLQDWTESGHPCTVKYGRTFTMIDPTTRRGFCTINADSQAPVCAEDTTTGRICTKQFVMVLNSDSAETRTQDTLSDNALHYLFPLSTVHVYAARLSKAVLCKDNQCHVTKQGYCVQCPYSARYWDREIYHLTNADRKSYLSDCVESTIPCTPGTPEHEKFVNLMMVA